VNKNRGIRLLRKLLTNELEGNERISGRGEKNFLELSTLFTQIPEIEGTRIIGRESLIRHKLKSPLRTRRINKALHIAFDIPFAERELQVSENGFGEDRVCV
jgi:hypothetical protein